MTKLKIDLRNGVVEVEGEEAFVKEIFNQYKSLVSDASSLASVRVPSSRDEINTGGGESKAHSRVRVGARGESHAHVSDLNLRPEGKQSLREFVQAKKPQTAMEYSAVFVYYLTKIAQISNVTADHIYTCYKDISAKVPTALTQSLKDTSYRKGWIDTKDSSNVKLTISGENFVEHDLPAKSTSSNGE